MGQAQAQEANFTKIVMGACSKKVKGAAKLRSSAGRTTSCALVWLIWEIMHVPAEGGHDHHAADWFTQTFSFLL